MTYRRYKRAPAEGDVEYVESGNEFGDQPSGHRHRRKWETPETDFQTEMLEACHRKWFRTGEKYRVVMIEKSMMSLETGMRSVYPTEWIYFCMGWSKKKWAAGEPIILSSLLSFIDDTDKRVVWVEEWLKKNKDKISKKNTESFVRIPK